MKPDLGGVIAKWTLISMHNHRYYVAKSRKETREVDLSNCICWAVSKKINLMIFYNRF
jgi:hypothetical protein